MGKPFVLWFTGLSGAGKTTIATAVEQALVERGLPVVPLDADVLRQSISADLGFDDESRKVQARRIAALAASHVASGSNVIVAAITPFDSSRREARQQLGDDCYVEIFVDTPLDVAESRDPKGLYARARAGVITNFTGITSVFERPSQPNLVLDTTTTTPASAAAVVLTYLETHHGIPTA
jgi:adenylyl-sulfate kinase